MFTDRVKPRGLGQVGSGTRGDPRPDAREFENLLRSDPIRSNPIRPDPTRPVILPKLLDPTHPGPTRGPGHAMTREDPAQHLVTAD